MFIPRRSTRAWVIVLAIAAFLILPVFGQNDWPNYSPDPGQNRYTTLKQITPANVAKLKVAWTYRTGERYTGTTEALAPQWEVSPIMVGGMVYLSTNKQNVVALQPETGKEIWRYTLTPPLNPPNGAHRGVAYWAGDNKDSARIIHATSNGRVIALDPKTGKPIPSFGDNGVIDTRIGYAEPAPADPLFGATSPVAIYKDLFIIGQRLQEGGRNGPPGDCRAFSLRTGKLVWTFHGTPRAGEVGNETWENESWKDRGGPSLWSFITVDVKREMVFLPFGQPERGGAGDGPGMNLFSDSVVALDANTGKLKWYFQTTHHDMWDFDVPSAPLLIDMVQNGKRIPIVVVTTKLGALFFLDRLTGKPIFGVEERPVPQSDVPGEKTWPTQPFPVKPPLVGTIRITKDDIANISPESHKYCEDWFNTMHHEGAYTPGSVNYPTLSMPGSIGGLNWPGPAFDPKLGYIIANSYDLAAARGQIGAPAGSGGRGGRFADQNRYPCQKPPWGRLTAINANTGDFVWQVPLGSYAELEAKGFPNTGAASEGGPIVTASGLIFMGGTNDKRFRAFETATGKMLWMTDLENTADSTPIAYMGRDGKQYVVITATGPGMPLRRTSPYWQTDYGESVVAFALPSPAAR